MEPWQWELDVIHRQVGRVTAGRSLLPRQWPGGARLAVALSFDSDHETIWLRDGDMRPGKLSQGAYGSRTAVPRILSLLERHQAPASFYLPAVSASLHSEEVQAYAAAGHEVALHGWIHERNTDLPAGVERELTLRAADVLEKLSGSRPVGIRTPSWDFSAATFDIIRELGLLYDSSLMADDDPYEILADGKPTGVVEIPVDWIRDDAPYFPSDPARPLVPPRLIAQMWEDEFEGARRSGGLFQLTMHPHVIGHRSRLVALEHLLERITAEPHVWLATHADIARYLLEADGANGTTSG